MNGNESKAICERVASLEVTVKHHHESANARYKDIRYWMESIDKKIVLLNDSFANAQIKNVTDTSKRRIECMRESRGYANKVVTWVISVPSITASIIWLVSFFRKP